jgi:metal-responsive CopG/Arc/MetJ family transcriptional regulator
MESISLKLPEDLLAKSAQCAQALCMSRAEYIRRAIDQMNCETRAMLRAKKIAEASKKVRTESMEINAEFEAIEEDLDA